MRVEFLPVIFGALVALLGLALLVDAKLPDGTVVPVERRRRPRAERSRGGEAAIGLGTLGMAAALIGRDSWRYGTIAVILGTLLLLVGAWMNRRLLGELFSFRGAARRSPEGSRPPVAAPPAAQPGDPPRRRLRIR
ncbi:MAG TPA: hypothetical protein VFJ74_11975 [Gemmatimonadaceae bacterium]|nr:hypothetical protein [Gemmatimonadaceae bacterium]